MSIARDPETIRSTFAELRKSCDPRSLDVLDELERWMLVDNAYLALQQRVTEVQEEIMFGKPGKVIPFPGKHSVKA